MLCSKGLLYPVAWFLSECSLEVWRPAVGTVILVIRPRHMLKKGGPAVVNTPPVQLQLFTNRPMETSGLLLLQGLGLLICSQGSLCFWLLAQRKHLTQQPKYASCASGQDITVGLISLYICHVFSIFCSLSLSLYALVVQYKQSDRSVCKHASPGFIILSYLWLSETATSYYYTTTTKKVQ